MARIRTIKPEFYRHEELQDLEREHPTLRPMLVFSALWGHCDKTGVFPWRPRQLALDILPFVWTRPMGEEIAKTLDLLGRSGFLERGEHDGKPFGRVVHFADHQRINGKEANAPTPYPAPDEITWEAPGKHPGSTREAPGKHLESQEVEVEVEGEREVEKVKSDCPESAIRDAPVVRRKRVAPEPDPQAVTLANVLADLILERHKIDPRLNNGKRPKTVLTWAHDIDKLHRIDGVDWDNIEGAIRWSQADTFWQANVLSGAKLRKQFHSLMAQANRKAASDPMVQARAQHLARAERPPI